MTTKLPKLPEPHGWYLLTGHGNSYDTQRPQCLMVDAWKPAYSVAQTEAYAREAVANQWSPSGVDYDRAIHSSPDAKEWADLFVATFPALADKHDLMLAWFANAMMAMHDHINRKADALRPSGDNAEHVGALNKWISDGRSTMTPNESAALTAAIAALSRPSVAVTDAIDWKAIAMDAARIQRTYHGQGVRAHLAFCTWAEDNAAALSQGGKP